MKLLPLSFLQLLMPRPLGIDGDAAGGASPAAAPPAASEKTFTQAELDAAIAQQVAAAVTAAKAPFTGIDVDEYEKLKADEVKRAEDLLKSKGQYEQLLANTVKEKDVAFEKAQRESEERIKMLAGMLERSEVDGKLLSAATAHKALKPDQVAALLRGSIKFDPITGVSVVDAAGNLVSKNGKPVTVAEHVQMFLEANQHFLAAGPGGAGSQGSGDGRGQSAFKISVEDAKDPAKYRAARDPAMIVFIWAKFSVPIAVKSVRKPRRKPTSPIRVVRKAFIEAFAAESFSK